MTSDTDDQAPRVSVILGTRDRQELVSAAVRSALEQSFGDFELLVFDDASDPPVELTGGAAADPRVTLVRFDEHVGIAEVRNEGMRRARAPYVAFLDDDDVWMPRHLDLLFRALEGAPSSVAGVYAGFEKWDRGRPRWRFLPSREEDLFSKLLARNVVHPTCSLMKLDALIEAGGFNRSFERSEDWDLFLRLLRTHDLVAVPAVTVRVGWHPPPAVADLAHLRKLRERWADEIAALPERQRRTVESHHQTIAGILLARLGRPAEARRSFLRALRAQPTRLEPLWHLPRTYLGEERFERLIALIRRLARGLTRAVGVAPPVTRY